MKLSSKLASDYSKKIITIEIESREELKEVMINNEKLIVPVKGQDGKYILQKDVIEKGKYTVTATDVNGNVTTQEISITDDEITKDFNIYTLEDMKKFRDMVNSGRTFVGRTVTLMNDIDLQGMKIINGYQLEIVKMKNIFLEHLKETFMKLKTYI